MELGSLIIPEAGHRQLFVIIKMGSYMVFIKLLIEEGDLFREEIMQRGLSMGKCSFLIAKEK